MKKISKLLKNHKNVCFIDFEGTQFSHECIAIGAVLAQVTKEGRIVKYRKPFKVLVKAKNKIGKYVEVLTGISEDILANEGVNFATAIDMLYKYLGNTAKSNLYVTYGNHDMTILNSTISYNLDAPVEKCRVIQKNHLDFQEIFNEYVKDDSNQTLSLANACRLFQVESVEDFLHNPEYDSVLLMKLWDAFIERKDILFVRYKQVLRDENKLPEPIKKVIKQLNNGEEVTVEDYDSFVREDIDNL